MSGIGSSQGYCLNKLNLCFLITPLHVDRLKNWLIYDCFRDLTVPMHLGLKWRPLCAPYEFMGALLLTVWRNSGTLLSTVTFTDDNSSFPREQRQYRGTNVLALRHGTTQFRIGGERVSPYRYTAFFAVYLSHVFCFGPIHNHHNSRPRRLTNFVAES